MKAIIIKGASNAGKSSTINEICRVLEPTEVYHLRINRKDHKKSILVESKIDKTCESSKTSKIRNNTHIIKVDGKFILVCVGSPTEQCVCITDILAICKNCGVDIEYAIIAMRTIERKVGYDTCDELKKLGVDFVIKVISSINPDIVDKNDDNYYTKTKEWKERISEFVAIIRAALSSTCN